MDFYKVLDITEFADADEIKKAYRKASLKYHPDKYSGDPAEAQAMMVQVNAAFQCLKNPATRKMYEYYENDYESMAQYEEQLKEERVKDLYLYDANVHIVWQRNFDQKLKNMTRITVLNLYDPSDRDSVKQVNEFKRFGKMAEKSSDLRAAVVNCGIDQGLAICHKFWQQMGRREIPALLIFSSLQPDETTPTDFEVWNDEKFGFPTAKEIARQARKLVSHEVVQADGAFFEANVTRNPVREADSTALTVWIAWLYHTARCAKTDICDKTAPSVRKLSQELKGIARIVAIDCKVHKTACRGHLDGASALKVFVHRGSKHFVEAFRFDVGEDPPEATALRGAAMVLKYVLKPQVNLTYPANPFRPEAAAEEAAAEVDLSSMDPRKMKVSQLRELLASLGAKCVGCSEKADFVARVLELRGGGASGEL